jgi:tetratricopeptide (TPR) repeat protein
MAISNLFSKRQKVLRGEVSDIYSYDTIPPNLLVQVTYIIKDAIGKDKSYSRYGTYEEAKQAYRKIYDILCREYGKAYLTNGDIDPEAQIFNFLQTNINVEKSIDVIELCCKHINTYIRNLESYSDYAFISLTPSEAISDLNTRFKENSVGYAFEGNEIVRVDSTYIHSEIAKPTIALLYGSKFQGANEEYMKAHEHYRHGRNKECLTECLKAFESTMKIICTEKGWTFDKGDAAKKLIQICLQHGLVPEYMQTQISSLKGLFESGIPTIRNKLGGHGQGAIPQTVDDRITRYGLNLTGTNIIFMIEQSGL